MSASLRQIEIDRNFEYFLGQLKELDRNHRGEYALLRHQQIVGFFARVEDAAKAAEQQYPDRLYSIQVVEPEPVDLGFVARA